MGDADAPTAPLATPMVTVTFWCAIVHYHGSAVLSTWLQPKTTGGAPFLVYYYYYYYYYKRI